MIKEETLKKIAKRAGINESEFLTALKAESDKDISIEDDGEFMTTEEIQSLGSKPNKTSYEEGKKAGLEILIKESKRLAGVEFEGKTVENLVTALKEKYEVDAKQEPNAKIETLQKEKVQLQKMIDEKEGEIAKREAKITDLFIESNIKTKLPDKTESGLTREDLFILYGAKRKFNRTDNGLELIDPKTNEVIKDKKLNPVSIDNDINEFLSAYGKPANPGRGGLDQPLKGDNSIDGLKKMSDVHTYCEKNNIPLNQQPTILAKAAKNEGFDYNS